MDLGYLDNPVNTIVTAITLLAALGGILFFLGKRKISVGKNGIILTDTEQKLGDKIPLIDRRHQNAMRDITSDNKDIMLALMSTEDKTHQLLLLFKILDVIRHKIYVNHLTRWFSDDSKYEAWKAGCVSEVLLRLRYISKYADIYFDLGVIEKDTQIIIDKLKELLVPELENMINEKLLYYRSLEQTDKVKELIEKNERYLRGL